MRHGAMAFAALIGTLSSAAAAQLAPTPLVAPEAQRRVLDYATVFPITPAFAEWQRADDGSIPGHSLFMHSRSVRPMTGGYLVDILARDQQGDRRIRVALECSGDPVLAISSAVVDVTVSGDEIRPISETLEGGGVEYLESTSRTVGARLCAEPGYRARFGQLVEK